METQNKFMFDHGVLANLLEHPVNNQAIIEEEENGYGLQLSNHHVTEIRDRDVHKRIIDMSIIEIIN